MVCGGPASTTSHSHHNRDGCVLLRVGEQSVIHAQVVGAASIANAVEQNTSCDSRRVARSSTSVCSTAQVAKHTLGQEEMPSEVGVTHLTSSSGSEVAARLIIWSTHGELVLRTIDAPSRSPNPARQQHDMISMRCCRPGQLRRPGLCELCRLPLRGEHT